MAFDGDETGDGGGEAAFVSLFGCRQLSSALFGFGFMREIVAYYSNVSCLFVFRF